MRGTMFAVGVLVVAAGCGGGSTAPTGNSNKQEKQEKQQMQQPCHPGCFPAGTPVATPDGVRSVEALAAGDLVLLVGDNGVAVAGSVRSTFNTCNKLVEVRTDAGNLVTTETQPLCLTAGAYCRAGELKAGDEIWRWADGRRQAARVVDVAPTERTEAVFNLVVGGSAVFVAGGFLARGKPPAE